MMSKPGEGAEAPIAGYVSDSPLGPDLLDIDSAVSRIASMLASRSVQPPLSIGLFGGRGWGKSFFMSRVAHRVRRISDDTSKVSSDYCERIVQVDYNAWHYEGANQWIALAEAIYSSLGRRDDATGRGSGRDLLSNLPSLRKLHSALASKCDRERERQARAEAEMEEARRHLKAVIKENAELQSEPKWTNVARGMRQGLSFPILEAIDNAGETLGLRRLSSNPEQFIKVLDEAKTIAGRASLLTNALKSKRFVGNALLVAVGLLLMGVFVFIAGKLYYGGADLIDRIGKGLATVSTLGGFIAVWIGLMLRNESSKAIDALQDQEPDIRDIERRVDDNLGNLRAVAQDRVTLAQRELEAARTRTASAHERLSEAEQEVAEFYSIGLAQRIGESYRRQASSTDNVARPNLVPMIRGDLEDLSAILQGRGDEGDFKVERIAIFIDDLDRCSPETVFAVLQGLGLLLSFPCFVVVVAADLAWLEAAIGNQNRFLSEYHDNSSKTATIGFLEQLIHVPYWIKPLSKTAGRQLVRALAHTASGPFDEQGNLGMTPEESDYLDRVVELISESPRHVKRLFNTYFLIRSSLSEGERRLLLGAEAKPSTAPALITQTAIVTAAPTVARSYNDLLQSRTFSSVDELIEAWKDPFTSARGHEGNIVTQVLQNYAQWRPDNSVVEALQLWRSHAMRHSFVIPSHPDRVS